jgi:hypothetical protein
VSATSWNIGFAAGKLEPVETDSLVPFTEMTAEVGTGVGGAGGVFGGLLVLGPPPDDGELGVDFGAGVALEPGPPALNGSLLAKREKEVSCPVSAGAWTASMSCVEPVGCDAESVGSGALSDGAAGSAVPVLGAGVAGAAVVPAAAGSGFDAPLPFSDIIVCTAYAIASARTATRPIAIFFCFCAFALAASATVLFRATSFSSRAD